METVVWNGCYDESWNGGLVVDEAFSHPAKFAKGLIERIYDELPRLGVPPGSVVVDPFGGVGLGGVIGAGRGYQWLGCELENRFRILAEQNFALHRRTWEACGDPMPRIVCGDSRRLRENLAGVLADAVVSSPPYSGNEKCDYRVVDENGLDRDERRGMRQGKGSFRGSETYGKTPGQLGAMPAGSVDAVVSSPPFGDDTARDTVDADVRRAIAKRRGVPVENVPPGDPELQEFRQSNYGTTPGQLGAMPSGSVDAVVSSPPYEGSSGTPSLGSVNKDDWGAEGGSITTRRGLTGSYGNTEGQLGHTTGDTFWSAASEIVAECYAILKPGGIAVWVCKDFVRKGQRVPFSDDWRRLCEAHGFQMVQWVQASLVKEERHPSLFGGEVVKRKERKSFFRRLAEKKGSPAIDHEDVLIMRRPVGVSGEVGSVDAVVSSPPYAESNQDYANGFSYIKADESRKGSQADASYGTTPGQLGAMKPGSVEDVL